MVFDERRAAIYISRSLHDLGQVKGCSGDGSAGGSWYGSGDGLGMIQGTVQG